MFVQRDLSAEPSAECPHPPSIANFVCKLYGEKISVKKVKGEGKKEKGEGKEKRDEGKGKRKDEAKEKEDESKKEKEEGKQEKEEGKKEKDEGKSSAKSKPVVAGSNGTF